MGENLKKYSEDSWKKMNVYMEQKIDFVTIRVKKCWPL